MCGQKNLETSGAGWEGPQFRVFSLYRPKFRSLFLSLSRGLLVELWPRFKTVAHPKCAFVLPCGHFVRAPAAHRPRFCKGSKCTIFSAAMDLLLVHSEWTGDQGKGCGLPVLALATFFFFGLTCKKPTIFSHMYQLWRKVTSDEGSHTPECTWTSTHELLRPPDTEGFNRWEEERTVQRGWTASFCTQRSILCHRQTSDYC